jgi:hypothetical protein
MNETLFETNYTRLHQSSEAIHLAKGTILAFERYTGKDTDDATITDLKDYIHHLIDTNANKYNNVIHLARYFYYNDQKDLYQHMMTYFNSLGVLEHIIDRIARYGSEAIQQRVLEEIELPPFGTESTELPTYTKEFLSSLQAHTSPKTCQKILAGNNHGIPEHTQQHEKDLYEASESLTAYLKERHARKVAELRDHYEQNRIWYEQVITPDVIDFVAANQEILSAVLEDDTLYITKIPYDINRYLAAEDDTMRRYHACHCSFVREAIQQGEPKIDPTWCYCSAGFAKFPFERILDQELDIQLLKTPLQGDDICRFAIDLTQVDYKGKGLS